MSKDLSLLWKNVLKEIEKEISRANFITLFRKTSLIALDDGIATITAPSTMIIDMLQKRFSEKIKIELKKETSADVDVLFLPDTTTLTDKTILTPEHAPLFVESPTPKPLSFGHLPRVRPDFTFLNFAVSGSNQLAFVSSQAVASNPGTTYNPFFIYGPVGVGKTHLMNAIANEMYQKQPDRKIIYITSEEFTNEVVDAIKTNETAKMKRRFRGADLLLIDDIQFIEGKMVVQEELFHTFNILVDKGAQIVLSSDRPPEEIKKLEKRLSSRFAGGLAVDIQAPDFELKTAIILIKAQKFNTELPIEIAKLLAENANDTRTLEGLLLRLITKSTTQNSPITLDLARAVLGKADEEKREHLHAEDVIRVVCNFYRLKSTQLRGPKRDASLVKARQITMYLLKNKLGLTYTEIGNLLGGRDHTTVMHGVEKIGALVDNKHTLSVDIMGITNELNV